MKIVIQKPIPKSRPAKGKQVNQARSGAINKVRIPKKLGKSKKTNDRKQILGKESEAGGHGEFSGDNQPDKNTDFNSWSNPLVEDLSGDLCEEVNRFFCFVLDVSFSSNALLSIFIVSHCVMIILKKDF